MNAVTWYLRVIVSVWLSSAHHRFFLIGAAPAFTSETFLDIITSTDAEGEAQ